jgi:hypothetical protein
MSCPAGTIRRKGYVAVRSATHKAYRVAPACVPDVGKVGKTKPEDRIAFEADFTLEPYGYKHISQMKADARHSALTKAIQGVAASFSLDTHAAAVKVMRYVNLMSTLNRNTNKTLSQLLERDRNWIGRTYLGKDYTA